MRHENIGGRHHNRAGKDFGHKSGDALQEMQEKNLMNENCFNKRKRTTTDQKAYQAEWLSLPVHMVHTIQILLKKAITNSKQIYHDEM